MSSGCIYYTTPALEFARITTASSDPNSSKAKLLEQNLNSYWTSNGKATQYFRVDTSGSKAVNGYGLWIRNYNLNFSTAFCTLSGSNNATSWTGLKVSHINHINGGTHGPIFYTELSSDQTYRYYQFSLTCVGAASGVGAVIQISYPLLLTKHQMDLPFERPGNEANPVYSNKSSELNNLKISTANMKYPIYHFKREYFVRGQTEIDNALAIYTDSAGARNWFVYQQDPASTNNNASYLCSFMGDEIARTEDDYLIYSYEFEFESLPYIRPGDLL